MKVRRDHVRWGSNEFGSKETSPSRALVTARLEAPTSRWTPWPSECLRELACS